MSESKEKSSVAVKIEETEKEQEKPQQSNDEGKKVLKLNKKKDSKQCPRWVKWLVGILIFVLVIFIVLIILFPDLISFNADYIRVLCRFSTSFDTDSKWLQNMRTIIPKSGDYVTLKHYPFLKEVIIGNGVFYYFEGNVLITGLKRLKTVTIGNDNFSFDRKDDYYIEISHCPSLTSIVIGNNCFKRYNKGLILNDLPELESIVTGDFSFTDASTFQLENLPKLKSLTVGKDYAYEEGTTVKIKDLPSLETMSLRDSAFLFATNIVISNLPKLREMYLGRGALQGSFEHQTSLTLSYLPSLHTLVSEGDSFIFINNAFIIDIPNLQQLSLSDTQSGSSMKPFRRVSFKIVTNASLFHLIL